MMLTTKGHINMVKEVRPILKLCKHIVAQTLHSYRPYTNVTMVWIKTLQKHSLMKEL